MASNADWREPRENRRSVRNFHSVAAVWLNLDSKLLLKFVSYAGFGDKVLQRGRLILLIRPVNCLQFTTSFGIGVSAE